MQRIRFAMMIMCDQSTKCRKISYTKENSINSYLHIEKVGDNLLIIASLTPYCYFFSM